MTARQVDGCGTSRSSEGSLDEACWGCSDARVTIDTLYYVNVSEFLGDALILVFGAMSFLGLVLALSLPTLSVRPVDVAWIAGTRHVPEDETAVYRRYLTRHRLHRRFGAGVGAIFALMLTEGVAEGPRVTTGFASPVGDFVIFGIAGSLCGALSAETYRLSGPQDQVLAAKTLASLSPRDFIRQEQLRRQAKTISALTVAGAVLIALSTGAPAPLAVALLSLIFALVAHFTARAIETRRRPVLSDRAIRVDSRIRSVGAYCTAWLQMSAALLFAGWALWAAPIADRAPDFASTIRSFACIGLVVCSLIALARGRPGSGFLTLLPDAEGAAT